MGFSVVKAKALSLVGTMINGIGFDEKSNGWKVTASDVDAKVTVDGVEKIGKVSELLSQLFNSKNNNKLESIDLTDSLLFADGIKNDPVNYLCQYGNVIDLSLSIHDVGEDINILTLPESIRPKKEMMINAVTDDPSNMFTAVTINTDGVVSLILKKDTQKSFYIHTNWVI